jgi:hypothetical protein
MMWREVQRARFATAIAALPDARASRRSTRMGEKGLRVLAFAARLVEDCGVQAMTDDPKSLGPLPAGGKGDGVTGAMPAPC